MDNNSTEPIRSEGRHLAGLDAADKIDANFEKYRKSDKGKEAYKKYQTSEKGKKVKKEYFASEKGKEAIKKYRGSEKGQTYLNDKRFTKRIFRKAASLQKIYTNWSSDDCLEEALKQIIEKEESQWSP